MKRLFITFVTLVLVCLAACSFQSCERSSDISPIKGVWKYQLNGGEMTLEYGDHNVKYKCHLEYYKATAFYEGTYTIKDNVINHEFTSLTTKNSSRIEYYSPERMPKEAVLQDENTIIYMDYLFTRE